MTHDHPHNRSVLISSFQRGLQLSQFGFYLPEGSVWNKRGVPSSSKPVMRTDIPKGRLPLDCVYFCFSWAINLVMYSRLTRSSTVSLCDWHSILARSIKILASAVRPANATNTWLSMEQIFLIVLSTCSFATDFFSTAKTTMWSPLTPTYMWRLVVKGIVRRVFSDIISW